jgi:hypothetical protein
MRLRSFIRNRSCRLRWYLATMLFGLSAFATAAWTKLVSDSEFDGYAASAQRTGKGGHTQLWQLDNLKVARNSAVGRPYYSVTTLWEFDCADKMQRLLSVNWHAGQMGTGEIVQSQQAAGAKWEAVSAGRRQHFRRSSGHAPASWSAHRTSFLQAVHFMPQSKHAARDQDRKRAWCGAIECRRCCSGRLVRRIRVESS